MIQNENGAASLAGLRRTHHPRCASADNNDVPPMHQRFPRWDSLAFLGSGL